MIIPFDTHTIYITLDDDKIYELKSDYQKFEVLDYKDSSKENPTVVLHKKQFDAAKKFLMNKNNPFKINKETAVIYRNIGFISDFELNDFIEEPSDTI